jgi:hypothetical protein
MAYALLVEPIFNLFKPIANVQVDTSIQKLTIVLYVKPTVWPAALQAAVFLVIQSTIEFFLVKLVYVKMDILNLLLKFVSYVHLLVSPAAPPLTTVLHAMPISTEHLSIVTVSA